MNLSTAARPPREESPNMRAVVVAATRTQLLAVAPHSEGARSASQRPTYSEAEGKAARMLRRTASAFRAFLARGRISMLYGHGDRGAGHQNWLRKEDQNSVSGGIPRVPSSLIEAPSASPGPPRHDKEAEDSSRPAEKALLSPHAPRRGLADVDVGARGGAGNATPSRDERDAGRPEVLHEHPPLPAVGVNGHIQGIAVVEAHASVKGSLAEGADRPGPAEACQIELLEPGGVLGQRPGSSTEWAALCFRPVRTHRDPAYRASRPSSFSAWGSSSSSSSSRRGPSAHCSSPGTSLTNASVVSAITRGTIQSSAGWVSRTLTCRTCMDRESICGRTAKVSEAVATSP